VSGYFAFLAETEREIEIEKKKKIDRREKRWIITC
jgi:hypothetical protein